MFGVFTNDFSLKTRKTPRIFPLKSRGNLGKLPEISGNFRKFREIPEVVPGKSFISGVFTHDYSLKPRKNPRISPPKFRENSRNPGNLRNPRNSQKSGKPIIPFFGSIATTPFRNYIRLHLYTTVRYKLFYTRRHTDVLKRNVYSW